jgi:hypothetical protein
MADSGCPIITGGDPAVNAVTTVQSTVMGFAGQAFEVAIAQANALNNFQIIPYNFSINFDVDGTITGYQRPAAVGDPDIEFDPHPAFDTLATLQWPSVSIDNAPEFTDQPLPVVIPNAPILIMPPEIAPPVLADVNIPLPPDFELPPVPQMRDIVIPADPIITIPTFDGVAPVRTFTVPDFNFAFVPDVYASDLLDETRERVRTMLQGGTGLPYATNQALFQRAAEKEDMSSQKAYEEVEEEVSSRGFSEPNGILSRRKSEIRVANRLARAGVNRDIYIQDQTVAIENLRFAVEKGIALEQVLQDLFIKQQELLLDSLKFQADLEVKFVDANVAVLNVDATIYQAKAAVFRDLLQAALAELEIYKAKLEGKKLIGDLNRQDIDLYVAQLGGVEKLIEIFNAEINAQNAISANNNSRVQAYVGQQQGRSESIRAIGYEFDAYKTQVEAEKIKPDIFDSQARAFGSRVTAYAAAQNVKLERGRFDIAKNQAIIQEWVEENRNEVVKLQAQRDIVSTKLDTFRAFLDRMRIEADIEGVASQSNARIFQLALTQAEQRMNAQLKSVELLIDQNEKVRSILLEAMRTSATVSAQLAGSSLSALNASASISHSSSQSSGCSTSFNFSGSINPDE